MTSAGHRSHREQRATPCHRMCVVCRDSCAGRVGAPARQTNSFRNSKLSVSLSSYVDIPWRADCVVPSCSRSQSFSGLVFLRPAWARPGADPIGRTGREHGMFGSVPYGTPQRTVFKWYIVFAPSLS